MRARSQQQSSPLYPFIVVAMLLLGLAGVAQGQFTMPPIPAVLSVLLEGVGIGLIGAGVGYIVLRIVRPTREEIDA